MDVYFDCEASVLDHDILNQAFVFFLLSDSRRSMVQNGSLVVVYFCGTRSNCGHLSRGTFYRLYTSRRRYTQYARPLSMGSTSLMIKQKIAVPVRHVCAGGAVSAASCTSQWRQISSPTLCVSP